MHARKMAACLQDGAGKPVAKLVDELSDEMSFLFHELAMT
jgi:hypothetical protein